MSEKKTNPGTDQTALDAAEDALVGTHGDDPDGDAEGGADASRPPVKSP